MIDVHKKQKRWEQIWPFSPKWDFLHFCILPYAPIILLHSLRLPCPFLTRLPSCCPPLPACLPAAGRERRGTEKLKKNDFSHPIASRDHAWPPWDYDHFAFPNNATVATPTPCHQNDNIFVITTTQNKREHFLTNDNISITKDMVTMITLLCLTLQFFTSPQHFYAM